MRIGAIMCSRRHRRCSRHEIVKIHVFYVAALRIRPVWRSVFLHYNIFFPFRRTDFCLHARAFLRRCSFSALLLLPKSWIWLLAVAALAGGGLYMLRAQLIESASVLVSAVTQQYSEAIPGIQVIQLTDAADADATLIFILIAALYALLCSWTVMRSEGLVYLLVLTVPVLALCLIILQTPPAVWAILLVVGILALLLLTQLLRARQAGEGNRLALLLAAPLALLIGLIAVLFPAGTYERAEWSDRLQETISMAADKLTLFRRDAKTGQVKFTSPISPSTLGSYLWDSSVTGVNLNRVGPQRQFGRSVMRVKATLGSSWAGASFYLRGDSMAVYEDNRWKPLPENAYPDMKNMHNPLLAGEAVVSFQPEVTIETDMKSGIYYIPYNATAFPEDAEPFYDAYVKNPSQQTNYTVPYVLSRSPLQNSAYDAFVHETYTQVPDETRQALSDILSELVGEEDADPYQYIPRVLEYVSASARYDLNTPAVPDGEDFVSWFLHDSETGYCVHYATAATILLRCLGVPARYVTGYYTDVYENEWTTVTSDDAHAWVEIYLNGIGWLRMIQRLRQTPLRRQHRRNPLPLLLSRQTTSRRIRRPQATNRPLSRIPPQKVRKHRRKRTKSPSASCVLFGLFWHWPPHCFSGAHYGSASEWPQ